MKSKIKKSYCKRWGFFLILGLPLLFSDLSYGDSLYSKIEKGSALYDGKKYDEAVKSFIDAQIESPENPKLKYNVANTHYKMRNYEEAVKNYQDVAATAQDIQLEEKSIYNIGNCMYRQGRLEEAVEYYKKALELDPNDQDAKYNLEFVREEIKKRINQAKQRKNQQEQEKSEKQEGEKEQEAKGQNQQPKEEQQKKQQKQQQASKEKQQKASRKQKEKTKPMSPEEAERWLRSLKEDKKKHKERERGKVAGSLRSEKDW
ncbi:MAG: tetratricopeptide repeat protein [Deltaproteobacteria bacterium]|nr:tetratricopeptide repeat protein [Deltaproteobacteria bacterium]